MLGPVKFDKENESNAEKLITAITDALWAIDNNHQQTKRLLINNVNNCQHIFATSIIIGTLTIKVEKETNLAFQRKH